MITVEQAISTINQRRPLDDNKPEGYMESDRDFVLNNIDACVAFLEHNTYQKLVEILRETRRTLEVLLTCDHCAACEYCNSHKIVHREIIEIDAALAEVKGQ